MHYPSLKDLPKPPKGKIGWPWTKGFSFPPIPEYDRKNQLPIISIVTPSFNQGQFIEETIRSVLLQGYPKLEYIIMDGGSIDESVAIIKKYENWLTFWTSKKDRGQSQAINKGWKIGSGSVLAWLNSDDVYAAGALYAVSQNWCENDNPQMLFGDAVSTDVNLQPFKRKDMNDYSLKVMLSGKRMPQPAVFVSRELIRKIGPLNESLYFSMDFDLYMRAWMSPEAKNFYHIPKVLAFSRRYKETKCQSGGYKRIDENVHVLKMNWDKYMRPYQRSEEWRKYIAAAYVNLAQRYISHGKIIEAAKLLIEAQKFSIKTFKVIILKIPIQLLKRILKRSSNGYTHVNTSRKGM